MDNVRPTGLAFLLILTAAAANAATYYVAPGGNDESPGTPDAPFLTITRGVSTLRPGDTLYVGGGRYNETVVIWGMRGTSSAPIRLVAYSGENPHIDGTGTAGDGVVSIGGGSSHITLDGFEVTSGPNHGISVYDADNVKIRWNHVHHNQGRGISVASSSSKPIGTTHHVLVEGNKVHHNVLANRARSASSGWQQGLSAWRAAYVDIIGNYVHENYGEGIDYIASDHGNISGNTVYDNFSVNIYLDNAQHTIVDRNYVVTGWSATPAEFYRNGSAAHGIAMANERYPEQNPLTDIAITNNIVVRAHLALVYWDSEYGGGLHNTLIANNTFVHSSDLLLYIENGSPEVHGTTIIENNIFYARAGNDYTRAPRSVRYRANCWHNGNRGSHRAGKGDVMAAPRLVNVKAINKADLKLRSSSPCIDAGTTQQRVTTDFWGTVRSGAYDIGAHENAGPLIRRARQCADCTDEAPGWRRTTFGNKVANRAR